MQAISPMSIRERHQNQSFGAHAQKREGAITREIYNERILNAIREKERTAQPGTVFYNAMTTDTYTKTRKLSELNDEQLKLLSKAIAAKDDDHKLGVYKAALIGIPALDTASRLATTAGTTATKLSAAGKTAGSWAGAFVLAGLYNGATNKIAAVSPVVRKFGDDHPVLSSLLNLAGFGGVLYGAQKGLDLLMKQSEKVFPHLREHIRNFAMQSEIAVNKSKINTKVIEPTAKKLTEVADKFPKSATVAKYALGLGAFAWASGIVFKAITDRAESKAKSDNIFAQLQNARQANINALGNLLVADKLKEKMEANEIGAAKLDIMEAKAAAYDAIKRNEKAAMVGEALDVTTEDIEEDAINTECCNDCEDC